MLIFFRNMFMFFKNVFMFFFEDAVRIAIWI